MFVLETLSYKDNRVDADDQLLVQTIFLDPEKQGPDWAILAMPSFIGEECVLAEMCRSCILKRKLIFLTLSHFISCLVNCHSWWTFNGYYRYCDNKRPILKLVSALGDCWLLLCKLKGLFIHAFMSWGHMITFIHKYANDSMRQGLWLVSSVAAGVMHDGRLWMGWCKLLWKLRQFAEVCCFMLTHLGHTNLDLQFKEGSTFLLRTDRPISCQLLYPCFIGSHSVRIIYRLCQPSR